jgi:hypothetical protein
MKMIPPISAVLGMGLAVAASADSIDTNRPGFSFTTGVVQPGQWQLETGLGYDRVHSREDAWSLPQAEFRFGLTGNIEGFVNSVNWTNTEIGDARFDGLTDWAAGIKANVTAHDATTQMAVLLQVGVPVGDDEFTSDRWDPSAAFIWHYQGGFQVAGTVKLSDYAEGYQLDNGLKLPFSLGGPHGTFLEWEANLPEHGEDTHYLNAGYQYLMGDNMQFDVNAGLGLNSDAGDYRVGIGFSFRP